MNVHRHPQRHDPTARHAPPPEGVDQPLRDFPPPSRAAPQAQASGGSGFVNVSGRLFAPLQGLDPNNVLQGGYGWLSVTDGGATYHPGLDLNSGGSCNADEGLLVVSPLAGIVRQTLYWDGYTSGEGNHVWVELDDPCLPGPTWWHTDHLQAIHCLVGERLTPGDPIGLCGRTGGWDCAHAHTELLKGPPQYGWWQWPKWWTVAQVQAAYYDPSQWWSAATALVLAEGGQPIPPEVVTVLEDWQVAGWILADLFAWNNIPFNPDAGTTKAWISELRAGRYRGRPRTGERPYGEGDQSGVWMEWDGGVLCYRTGDGTASWNG